MPKNIAIFVNLWANKLLHNLGKLIIFMEKTPFQKNYLYISAYCAAQERCRKEVRDKLKEREVEQADIQAFIDLLEAENFLNELRYAQSFARDKCRFNKWGKVKIAYELRLRRIGKENIEKGLESIDEEFYEELIEHLAQRKWAEVKRKTKDKQAVYRYLAQKGFENELIGIILKKLE